MTYNELSENLLLQLKDIVGKEYYFDEFEIRWTYAFGGSIFYKEWIPDVVLLPQSANQISKILKLANEHKIPVTPRGSGTSLSAGTMTPYKGIVIDLSQMNKILKISIENNIVELEPGVICDDLNEELKLKGYFFPPDPGSSSVATIGGMVAGNAGGVQAFKYGVTKNYVLYIEVALPNGEIIKLGTRVLKSVSSYNLKDLFIGSEGTLGIITKIGLKIRPFPKERKLGFFIFENIEDIADISMELRKKGIVTNLLEYLDKSTITAVYEYLGGEFSSYPVGHVLIAEVDGNNLEAVKEEFVVILELIKKRNPIFYKTANTLEERDRLINARKSNLPALSRLAPTCCVEDCTIQITDFVDIVKKIWDIPSKISAKNLKVTLICHMEGNLHPTFLFNENNENDVKEFEKAIDYLYKEIILPAGGTLTGEHGIGKIKSPYLELEHGKHVVEMMKNIKNLFDPNCILNPGIGKGDSRKIHKIRGIRKLKNQPKKLLELNCMRCGFCTVSCPSKIHYLQEAYSPRGRLSILNGLVHGELKLNELINEIFHACTLCGLCLVKCPAGVKTNYIFEKVREIIH
ncbi:MAG: FAD-binding protein [Promethearchaeota archaeon]